MSRDLIEVHCKEDKFLICDCCDDQPVYVKIYYRIAEPSNFFESSRKYGACCKTEVGLVVDWDEE